MLPSIPGLWISSKNSQQIEAMCTCITEKAYNVYASIHMTSYTLHMVNVLT